MPQYKNFQRYNRWAPLSNEGLPFSAFPIILTHIPHKSDYFGGQCDCGGDCGDCACPSPMTSRSVSLFPASSLLVTSAEAVCIDLADGYTGIFEAASGSAALNRGEYQQVQDTLTSIHHVLDQASMKENSPFAADSLANDYYAIVASILNYGYEPQRLTIDYLTAQVWVRRAKPELTLFKYTKIGGAWVLDAETLALKPFFLH